MAADELVRVRIGDIETNMGRVRAEKIGAEILDDESARRPDGRLRRDSRKGGRRLKPKVPIKKAAAPRPPPDVPDDPEPRPPLHEVPDREDPPADPPPDQH